MTTSMSIVAVALLGMSQAAGETCAPGKSADDCVRPRSPIDEVACPRASALKYKIGFCERNTIAPDQADNCRLVIKKQKDAVIAAYAAAMTMTDREAMRQSLMQSVQDVIVIQDEADRVGAYTHAMIDFPGSRGPETSAPCFNESFDRLQKILNEIDDAIVEAKAKHKEAVVLFKKKRP